MTREEIMAMTADELIIEIARLQGMTLRNVTDTGCELLSKAKPVMGFEYTEDEAGYWIKCAPPQRWPTSIADAWELEGEIPTGEIEEYCGQLTNVINDEDNLETPHRWQLIHATPEQRSRAWLLWKTEAE